MNRRLVAALRCEPVDRTPVWIMRQAGRYLPEYRAVRQGRSFQESVADPEVAAAITLQPIERFGMDGAVIFADIMTPLEAMGVGMTFDPGPRLDPLDPAAVAGLDAFDPARAGFVAETIRLVRQRVPEDTAVIGFAGSPVTLLAYLVEGGGSKDFVRFRRALWAEPEACQAALEHLAGAMNGYLRMQVEAGADVVQLFDTWAGLLDRSRFASLAVPAARTALGGLGVPRIYFAPGAGHTLDLQAGIGADGFGVDWRQPLTEAWNRLGDVAIQGNVDPAVLLTDPATIRRAVADVLDQVGGRPGHVMNLGHGIDRHTPPEHVAAFVAAVRP